MGTQIWTLLQKELRIEWRRPYAFAGIVMYLSGSIFLLYLGLHQLSPTAWVVLFWIVTLFTAITVVAKSFLQERPMQMLYYYFTTHPHAMIGAKMLYNALLMLVVCLLQWMTFALVFGSPIEQPVFFAMILLLGAVTFSLAFTMMSALAAKAHQAGLLAILCIPFIIPGFLLLIRLSKAALLLSLGPFPWKEVIMLVALDIIMAMLSLILFPYLWRD